MLSAKLTAAALAASAPGAEPALDPPPPASPPPAFDVAAPVAAETTLPAPEFAVPPAEPGDLAAPDPAATAPPPEAASAAPAEGAVYSKDEDFLAEQPANADDPFEAINRLSFDLFWAIDKIVIRPAAMVYRTVVPKPLRDGAHNALTNFGEPLVFANDLLQLRPKRALKSLARFLINSTIGLGGLFDIARRKPFNIAYHHNSLGSTFGVWGIKPGPYLFLPIGAPVTGPTTLRDLADWPQGLLYPKKIDSRLDNNTFNRTSTIVGGLDQRERSDAELNAMFSDAIDKYATFRANFLQNRAGEIASLKARDGEAPEGTELDDPLTDPAGVAPTPEPEGEGSVEKAAK